MSEFVIFVKESYLLFLVMSLCTTTLANAVDFYTGIQKAKAKKQKIRSGGLRRTSKKILEYWLLQLVAFCIDCLLVGVGLESPYVTCVIGVSILIIEGISIVENINERKGTTKEVLAIASQVAEIIGASDQEKVSKIIELLDINKKK